MSQSRCHAIFLKYPVPGQVKTRLAKTIGEPEAVEAYQNMVCEVIRQVKASSPDEIALFFSPADAEDKFRDWLAPWIGGFPGRVHFYPQAEGDLGDRLAGAVETVFGNDPNAQLLITGTDCIELDQSLLAEAWRSLEQGRIAIGPAFDGGYYLIGMDRPEPSLFRGIPWSTEETLSATLKKVSELGADYELLDEKTDIDTNAEYQSFVTTLTNRRCVFFDRDGVVNCPPGEGYVLTEADFHIQDGIAESIRVARDAGVYAVLVTSQKGVGKGLMTQADLDSIHAKMQAELAQQGAAFDAIYAFTGASGCDYEAKPSPAMLIAAANDFPIDLKKSWIVGDADRDIEMGQNAGLKGSIRVVGDKPIGTSASHKILSISELPQLLQAII